VDVEVSSVFRRYVDHDDHHAGVGRVSRAVLLSDTSPTLYYWPLNGWTLMLGTGDAALRLSSLLWAALAAPLARLIGRQLGGHTVPRTATLSYARSPVSIFYSLEGRMYSMDWLLAATDRWSPIGAGASRRRRVPDGLDRSRLVEQLESPFPPPKTC
jgi:hypothetical protein